MNNNTSRVLGYYFSGIFPPWAFFRSPRATHTHRWTERAAWARNGGRRSSGWTPAPERLWAGSRCRPGRPRRRSPAPGRRSGRVRSTRTGTGTPPASLRTTPCRRRRRADTGRRPSSARPSTAPPSIWHAWSPSICKKKNQWRRFSAFFFFWGVQPHELKIEPGRLRDVFFRYNIIKSGVGSARLTYLLTFFFINIDRIKFYTIYSKFKYSV